MATYLAHTRKQLEKDMSNFSKAGSARRTANYISVRLTALEKTMEAASAQIETALGSLAEKELEQAEDTFDQIRELYFEHRCNLLDAMDKIQPLERKEEDSQVDSKETVEKRIDIRLPKINLPVFAGSYESWRAFHDLFVSLIHHNASLSEIQKMHYLKTSVSGEAEKLLAHLGIDNGNYAKAWTILKDRYDHLRFLVNTQLKCLFNQPSISQERSESIKELLDTSTEVVHSLENLKVPVEHWDVVLIFVLLQKLPTKTQHLWEEKLGSKSNNKELPTFAEFTQFLETRFRSLEAVSQQQPRLTTNPVRNAPQRNSFHTTATTERFSCKICNRGQHSIRKCGRFLKMSTAERFQNVSRLGLCRNCLAYSHSFEECPSSRRCYNCQQPHHSLLHANTSQQSTPRPHNSNSPPQQNQQSYLTTTMNTEASSFLPNHAEQPSCSSAINNYHTFPNTTSQVLLATALVKVRSSSGGTYSLRALLDSGSQASFITESAVQLLGLKSTFTHVEVSGLGLVSSGTCQRVVGITLSSHNSAFETSTQAFILKSLSGHLPARTIAVSHWEHLNDLILADPSFCKPGKVDLLLGSDLLAEILLPELVKPTQENMPIAQNTRFGWILFGKTPAQPQPIRSFLQTMDVETQLRKFWEQEEAPYEHHETSENVACEEHFVKHVRRTGDGRYQVALPFKGSVYPILGRSYEGALQRFKSLERRLMANPPLHEQYSACLEEYINLGHMSEVKREDIPKAGHYFLPHHAVIKESSSTTRLRVVFDASFKTSNGVSLNDQLMIGPPLQRNVTDILLRWRFNKFTFTAGLEKMYRQIWVNEKDSYYQLVIWRKHPSDELKLYRLKTVTFGTAAAPYLAIRTLRELAEESCHQFPLASQLINEEMYVDDLISGADTLDEAVRKIKEVSTTLQSAGFNLRKWTSNRQELLKDIPSQDLEVSFSVPSEGSDEVKTLGIHWLPGADVFCFRYIPSSNPLPTKRFILSTIARLFDPLGWISPCVVKAKCFMQLLWVRKMSWDDPVDPAILDEWNTFYKDLNNINRLHFPRWIYARDKFQKIELHCFSDASEKAYGAAVYLRIEDEDHKVQMHLLASKSRVAPVKPISLPRLELCGAVMAAKLITYVHQTLKRDNVKMFAWTDSTIALCWISASPSKWETFVRNRVGEIQRLTDVNIWKHIPTLENPADLASRGMQPSDLLKATLWWNGPAFLHQNWEFEFPRQPSSLATSEGSRLVQVHHVNVVNNPIHELMDRSSNLNRLSRITGYCVRYISNLRKKARRTARRVLELLKPTEMEDAVRTLDPVSPNELESATKVLVRCAQQEMFPGDACRSKGLASLNPFLDGEGILRVGGRLKNSSLSFDQQHPIILGARHHLTMLIIRNAHENTLHGGIQLVMAYTRNRYWIIQTRRAVKKYLHTCVVCHRYRNKVAFQLMGNLPSPRVTATRPFTHTGVDYAGPITIRSWKGRGAKCFKGYLAIFVCLATKAMHLEAVSDLTTQAFLAAFRRFAARRGVCSQIYSDCGTNFVGAEAELHRLWKEAGHNWKEAAEALATHGTKWNFIPPASPHFGGLWEAGVKSVKHHFKRIVGNGTLTYEELSTLLTQIEACLNSRPLCPLTENPEDFQALTPAHFLIGEAIFTVPEPDLTIGKQGYLERWKAIQVHLQTFWKQWHQEYLARLQQRPKWLKPQPQLKIDDLVLIRDERLPPAKWNLGRIIETYPGIDKLTRVVKVRTQQGEYKRPITKLCPLPINEVEEAK